MQLRVQYAMKVQVDSPIERDRNQTPNTFKAQCYSSQNLAYYAKSHDSTLNSLPHYQLHSSSSYHLFIARPFPHPSENACYQTATVGAPIS